MREPCGNLATYTTDAAAGSQILLIFVAVNSKTALLNWC